MPRIRTFKPDFFRHELLQKLEVNHAELRPMLVFEALWQHCDKAGRFAWKPRLLKLDILPFVPFDMEKTLQLLTENGFVVPYESRGEHFGHIPTFKDHQRITGKEAESSARYPKPPEKRSRSDGETPGTSPDVRELGREGNGEKEKEAGTEGGTGGTVESCGNCANPPEESKAKPAPRGENPEPLTPDAIAKTKAFPAPTAQKKRLNELRHQTREILARRQ